MILNRLRCFLPIILLLLIIITGCQLFTSKPVVTHESGSPVVSKDGTPASDTPLNAAVQTGPELVDTSRDTIENVEASSSGNVSSNAPLVTGPSKTVSLPSDDHLKKKQKSGQAEKGATVPVEKEAKKKSQNADTEQSELPAQADPPTTKNMQSFLDESLDFCQAAQDFWQKGELENALEALDQAYSLILKIDGSDLSPEFVQQKEDLRLIISKRILEIYASRNIVANGQHNAIPLVINRHVQAEIDLFTIGRERNFFIESYKRSGRYRDSIVSELRKAGLPEELSWLPLIESGFKVGALSQARALGLWQFIPSTGFKFGLKRDVFIDERMDPEKSTQAAIAYLKELHQIFGDWNTALAAYNCGEGRVLRVIKTQNVNYLDDFWDLFGRLPFETARYVPRFLATLHVINNKERYGLNNVEVDSPFEFETLTVEKQMHLQDVAKTLAVNLNALTELNPELRYKMLPREPYPLRVPVGKAEDLLTKLDDIPVSARPQPAYVQHRVRAGESLSGIATRYRTSVANIARANNIRRANLIVAGQVLKIPQSGTYIPPARVVAPDEVPATHTVRSGDSLWNIANRYGTTTRKIQELNQLNSTTLSIGQVLRIPGQTVRTLPKGELKTYQVKHGDSPFKIAQQFKMPLEQFLRINSLNPRSTIYPGQRLYIE